MTAGVASVERIPVSPALARELGDVAGGVSRRVVASVVSAAAVLWPALFFELPSDGSTSVRDAALIATASAAAVLAFGGLVAWWWQHRINREPFIIRERGRFSTGGTTKAWLSGDRNDRWILVSIGHLPIHKDDAENRLEDAWSMLTAAAQLDPADARWEIDYTPHRYLLSVRDPQGEVVFARAGYVPPVVEGTFHAMTSREIHDLSDATWSRALRPLGAGFACLLGWPAVIVVGANAGLFPEGSPITLLAVLIEIGLFGLSLYLLVLGAHRTLALASQHAIRSLQGIRR